ncbi:hypothetical protein RMATCC62417_03667 [Rhizopus microsporus]|nr:hypothetical protein RMATCC62417_03667 [Rhizopus microsporus]
MPSILFLQKRFEYETIPAEFLSPAWFKASHRQLAQQLSFRKIMETNIAMSIKSILVAFGDNGISSLEAQIRLLSLASTVEGPQQNVIRAIESL